MKNKIKTQLLIIICLAMTYTINAQKLKFLDQPNNYEWYFEGAGYAKITKAYQAIEGTIITEYSYESGGEKRTGKNSFIHTKDNKYKGVWKTIANTGMVYEGTLELSFNESNAIGTWTWDGMKGNYEIKLLEKQKMENQQITFISFLYFEEGGDQKLEEFQKQAQPYFDKYGIDILHQYQPMSKGQIGSDLNEIEQPDMIQIFTSESMASFQAYISDEEVKLLVEKRNKGLRKMNVSFGKELETSGIISQSASHAVHGVALVSFKDNFGVESLIDFNHKGKDSGLFDKHGIHAESFVKVMKSIAAIGDLDYIQPELIVIFGVDDAAKMKEYISDSEYKALALIRDNALKTYHFFMCQ